MKDYNLIANSGIQLLTVPMEINMQEKYAVWFHEWPTAKGDEWILDIVHAMEDDNGSSYYKKKELYDNGFFAESQSEFTERDLREKSIFPLRKDDEMMPGVTGEIYKVTFADKRNNTLEQFENVWLPLPYFQTLQAPAVSHRSDLGIWT